MPNVLSETMDPTDVSDGKDESKKQKVTITYVFGSFVLLLVKVLHE